MDEQDTMRWVRRGSALVVLLIGWVFIFLIHHRHFTAPLVFLCLGYLAVVVTVYNLWRTGAATVTGSEDDGDSTWAKPAGALGELEREKRTLLKAIKEAEFDHQMGKLSQHDVDDMIRTYRARAIEVIKEIDRLGHGSTGSTREQIMREVRARLELEAKSQKKPEARPEAKTDARADATNDIKPTGKQGKPGKGKKQTGKPAIADEPASAAASASEARDDASSPDAAGDPPAVQPAHDPVHDRAQAAAAQASLDDELNADSTTAAEPKRDDPATEATP
jgi:hypothetical protein